MSEFSEGLVYTKDNLSLLIEEKEALFDKLLDKITMLQDALHLEERKLIRCVNEKNLLVSLAIK